MCSILALVVKAVGAVGAEAVAPLVSAVAYVFDFFPGGVIDLILI